MLQGVIFDLDGTLVDTMPIWEATIAEVFTAGGFPYNSEIYNRIMRAPIDQVAEELKQEFGLSANVEKMLAPLEQTFLRLVDSTKIEKTRGAETIIDALIAANIPFAIASSSWHGVVDRLLAAVGWQDRFPLVVSGDDIGDDKPAPDIFSEAAKRLGCDTQTCVVFEDAPKGVASAKAAGMKVIGIDDPRFALDLSATNRIITSFDQITVDDLKAMIN